MTGGIRKIMPIFKKDKTVNKRPKLYSDETESRFDEASYKLDRIVKFDEESVASEIVSRFGLQMDYADVLDFIKEHRLRDDNADEIIILLESIAQDFGYTPDMDNENVKVDMQKAWHYDKSMPMLVNEISREYENKKTDSESVDYLKSHIAGGLEAYKVEMSGNRPVVSRGEVWKISVPISIGYEASGNRWALVISDDEIINKKSYTVNVLFLYGHEATNNFQMDITENDYDEVNMEKSKSCVSLNSISTVDRLRFMEKKGKLKDEVVDAIMARVALNIGIKTT